MNFDVDPVRADDYSSSISAHSSDLRDRTKVFALRVIQLFSSLPKTAEAQVLGRQALRSGTSIGANYREAFRARSRAEFMAKMGECLKELEETTYWLELLTESGIVSADKLAPFKKRQTS